MNKVKILTKDDMKKFIERCHEKYNVPFYFLCLDSFDIFFHSHTEEGKCCVGDIMENEIVKYTYSHFEDKLILHIANKCFTKEERMMMQKEMIRLQNLIYDDNV